MIIEVLKKEGELSFKEYVKRALRVHFVIFSF
jgi:hypothetical protein